MSSFITPTVGVVYKFIFEHGYDAFNGTYRIVKLMSYDEYLTDGGNILTDFYEPNNKEESDALKDLEQIRNSKIMKLIEPSIIDDSVVYFAPVCFLKTTPDHNVKQYNQFGIICHVGVVDDVEHFNFICDNLQQQVMFATGIDPKPKLVTTGTEWLTENEYIDLIKDRENAKKKVVNYFSENKRLEEQLSSQNTLLQEYEKLIISQQKTVENLKKLVGNAGVRINFNPNGGSGEMNSIIAPFNDMFKLPECEFLPLENQHFARWNNNSHGNGNINGKAGDKVDISQVGDVLELYAIWEADVN